MIWTGVLFDDENVLRGEIDEVLIELGGRGRDHIVDRVVAENI